MSFGKILNLGSSIIGVSIVAMPYCFVKGGILLSIILILVSACFTRLSCHFLLKSAFLLRRRSFELMVHDVLGTTGKFMVKIGLVSYTLFLFGTCVAYFILIGDLSPVIAELLDIKYNRELRTITIIVLGLFVALPLCLLKNVDSLTSFSFLSMFLYSCLILKLMLETTDKLMDISVAQEKYNKVKFWDISGLLTTFPIFSLALSCQSSLFELLLNDHVGTLKKNNRIIRQAVYFCSFVYITIGLLGYMAFYNPQPNITKKSSATNQSTEEVAAINSIPIATNILLSFRPSLSTTLTRLGFIVSLLMSFPLCLFPCRTSVHSLIVSHMRKSNFQSLPMTGLQDEPHNDTFIDNNTKETNNENLDDNLTNIKTVRHSVHNDNDDSKSIPYNDIPTKSLFPDLYDKSAIVDSSVNTGNNQLSSNYQPQAKIYMSDLQFRFITIILITTTIFISVMIPNIEFILGLIGSTVGTTVCFILPAYTFLKLGEHSFIELLLARLLLFIGLTMLIFCSWSTIHNSNFSISSEFTVTQLK